MNIIKEAIDPAIRIRSRFIRFLCTTGATALAFCASRSDAMDIALPPVNLGDTSFEDGIAFPGWLVEETGGYYHAGSFSDAHGSRIPGANELTSVSSVTHVGYLSKLKILGGFYGTEILIPLVDVDMKTDFGPRGHKQGLGDLVVSPVILQWTDQRLFGMPLFQRVVVPVVLPTGAYDRHRVVNTGNHLVNLNPYYSFTLQPSQTLEVSARLHFLWNSRNEDPFVGLGATSTQPGQAFHANYAVSLKIAEGIRIGVNGYALQQLTEDKVNGLGQPNSKERVFAIGPGLKISQQTLSVYLNGYFESGTQNRPQGTKLIFRASKVF